MSQQTGTKTARRISAEEAAGLIRSGMWLDYGAGLGQPDTFDAALAARVCDLHGIKIRSCLTMRPRAVLEADPAGEHVVWFSLHFSGYDRHQHDAGRCNYLPVNLGEIPDYYRRFIEPVDVVVLKTCPMDDGGFFNFSAANFWHRAIIERAKVVIVEESRRLPVAHGVENGVHVSEVDYVIAGDEQAAPELLSPAVTPTDEAVAGFVASQIEDGDCLQIGIGAMPNAVCSLLKDSGAQDLGIHTEMLTDGQMALHEAGLVTGARKTWHPGKVAYTFALGTQRLYDWIDHNPELSCIPVDQTNLPHLIMRNDQVVSINNTTQVDLQGQAASESDGHRHLSGSGGQPQFVRGAYASPGGRSFICLASTFEKNGDRRSRIVLELTPGNVVTTTRSDVMYVVTEFGMVNLKGKSVAERALALISIAHPEFREGLERQAYEHRLIPRGLTAPA
ncbi:MAG: acetyl-CoA hydrolase/transferase C-terminal domain-containing protein [Nocardioidaceae bacterium]